MEDVKRICEKNGKVIAVISEGVKDKDGKYISSTMRIKT